MECWEGICKPKEEGAPSLIPVTITDPADRSLDRCRRLCSNRRSDLENHPPGKRVTACQYKKGGSCAYYTAPVKDWNMVASRYYRPLNSSADTDQCCVWKKGNINMRCILYLDIKYLYFYRIINK